MGSTTTVAMVLNNLAARVQENKSQYGGVNWSTGLWTVPELIEYINSACKAFMLDTQCVKVIDPIASVTGQRQYADPVDSMQIDRITFSNQALYRTKRIMLDRSDYKWRTQSGVPKQYHQDQLPIKNFETDRAPASTMTGSGYFAETPPTTGTLRQMAGQITYDPELPASGGGILRYAIGPIAYNTNSPALGLLRQMFTGLTNFMVISTKLPPDVVLNTDVLGVPDEAIAYIQFWVLRTMLEKEGEGQDVTRAQYCGARYDGGVALFLRLMSASNDKVTQPTGETR